MATKDNFNWSAIPAEMEQVLYSKSQIEVFRLLIAGYTWQQIGEKRGTAVRQVAYMAKRIKAQLEKGGYDPYNKRRGKPEKTQPQETFGKSELIKVGEDGTETVLMYWNKSKVGEDNKKTALSEFAKSLDVVATKPIPKPTSQSSKDLMNAIFIGDAHIGMYAYQPETRDRNFNSDIASKELKNAIDDLITRSVPADTGLLVNVGDFIHANTSFNTTGKGTPLDVDTRHHRVMQIAAETMAYMVQRMLETHKKVIVINARGNHDPDAAVALQLIMSAYYRNEPRVHIMQTQGYYHYLEWGKWLIAVHHGDKVKANGLVTKLARDQAEAWGRTTHRMWALGHFHHAKVLEMDGCTLRTFGTLAPADGWHAGAGYSSDSTMTLITFKKGGGTHSTISHEIEKPRNQPDLSIQ